MRGIAEAEEELSEKRRELADVTSKLEEQSAQLADLRPEAPEAEAVPAAETGTDKTDDIAPETEAAE